MTPSLPGSLALQVAGDEVLLLPDRALFWRDALILADLHLGKGDTFRQRGLPLPPGELDEDLARVGALVGATGARRVLVLGDFVHGVILPSTRVAVARWRATLGAQVGRVRGNHDRHEPELPPEWNVDDLGAIHREGPFALVHEPVPVPGAFTWAGHVHPTVSLRGRADRLRFPAFILGGTLGVLPAFARFSGGPGLRATDGLRRFACTPAGIVALG